MSTRDAIHVSDWPLNPDGLFEVTQLKTDCANPLHAAASSTAVQLHTQLSGVDAVYIRGSAIESCNIEFIRDVDLLLLADEPTPYLRYEADALAAALWPPSLQSTPCDIAVLSSKKINQKKFRSTLELIIAYRSLLLAGKPVWDAPPRLKPCFDLFVVLQQHHRKVVDSFVRCLSECPAKYDPNEFIPWMQKRALRLGGLIAMGVSGQLSRHPRRCTWFIRELAPNLAPLADDVANAYENRCFGASEWGDAVMLYTNLCTHIQLLLQSPQSQAEQGSAE